LIGFKVDSNLLWITDVHGKQKRLTPVEFLLGDV
jgi:hypothetical protein